RRGVGGAVLVDGEVGPGVHGGPLGGRVVRGVLVGGVGGDRGRVGQVLDAGRGHVHHQVQGGVGGPGRDGPQVPRHGAGAVGAPAVGGDERRPGGDGV